jgi:hypothetical protein
MRSLVCILSVLVFLTSPVWANLLCLRYGIPKSVGVASSTALGIGGSPAHPTGLSPRRVGTPPVRHLMVTFTLAAWII